MPTAKKTARATWRGSLTEGSGTITATGSGALANLPVSWKARTEEGVSATSPEELIAAAHAACYSMALSNGLAGSGHAPDQLDVEAVCTFEVGEGGARIASMALAVTGRVPGLDEEQFRQAAEAARDGCPVSKALKGNLEISVQARLG